jgi:hypothetical protein
MTRSVLKALIAVVLLAAPCPAQDWARKMFEKTNHDFGTIARDAKAEFAFVLTNTSKKDVRITGVRASCGCTTPRVEKSVLKPDEKGAVIAKINSRSFLGQQGATVTVTFDKPYYAEVQLDVKVFVRTDVVLDPAGATLGSVDRGTAAEKNVSVTYAGRNDWRIIEVKSANPHLSGKAVETARGKNKVTYNLQVRLDENAPPGRIKEYLTLVTNDRQSPHVPVAVDGEVLAELRVSPDAIFFGAVKPGEKVTKQVVVRSKNPFRITEISSDCSCLLAAPPTDPTAKAVHLIPITFVAGAEAGKVTKSIHIKTDLDGAEGHVRAYATVAP